MWNLFLWSQCFKKFFSTKSTKEDTIYMGIIYMTFLSRNLCKNIYTISSFMWSNELFSILKGWLYLYCIFLFSFFKIWSQLLKKFKIFKRNAELIFCDWLIQNCILRTKFLRFGAKITKITSAIIPQQFMIAKIFALKVSKQAICKFA